MCELLRNMETLPVVKNAVARNLARHKKCLLFKNLFNTDWKLRLAVPYSQKCRFDEDLVSLVMKDFTYIVLI